MWQQENEALSVTIQADAAAQIHDKRHNFSWRMSKVALQEEGSVDVGHVWQRTERSVCEQYAGRFQVEAQGDHLRYTLFGRERRVIGQFNCRVRLNGDWLEVAITQIDESIPSLVFPAPLESESLVIPMNVGKWIRKPVEVRRWWMYTAHLNMRWFGGLTGDHGWIAVIHQGVHDGALSVAELSAAPGWIKPIGGWGAAPRIIRYKFVRGGYVELAKTFRAYAMQHGLYGESLRDKIAAQPALGNLHGGRMVSMMLATTERADRYEDRLLKPPQEGLDVGITFKQAGEIVQQACADGLERGMVMIRGWINGGYDESHPDIFPIEPALGTPEELRALMALPDPLLGVLHDNYQDIYAQSASFPKGIIRTRRGELLQGGFWAGGQSYIINARDAVANARRNWPEIKTLNPRAMFIDTTIATQLYEDYTPGAELTRQNDQEYKVELLRFFREQDMIVGSEEGSEWGVPHVAWIENRHRRIAGESIPLWGLIYHDAAFCLRYVPDLPTLPESAHSRAPGWLADMLWGYPLMWRVRWMREWSAMQTAFASTRHVDQWHARIGLDEMLSHRYLTSDGEVEETVFTNGKIVANFSAESRSVDGITIPAQGYVLS